MKLFSSNNEKIQKTESQKKISYISGNRNPKKASYILGNGTFQPKPKKIFKKFSPKKISEKISENGTF